MESGSTAGDQNQNLHLPLEVWLLVFKKLDKKSLLRVRMTCRQWKQLVDHSQPLRDHFCINFFDDTVDDDFNPQNLFPAPFANFWGVKLVSVGSWWPSFGARLTALTVSGKVALPAFVAMLSATPDLEYLDITAADYLHISTEPAEVSWKLKKVKKLSCDVLFDIYEQIFPNLQELWLSRNPDEQLCRLLDSVQGTLKSLACYFTPYIVKRIAGMSRLKLIQANFRGQTDTAVELSRLQPLIEDLLLSSASNEDLFTIGRNLANLKKIDITLCETDSTIVPTFMANMPQLTELTMKASRAQSINFGDFKLPQLKTILLDSLVIGESTWSRFIANCPKLEEVALISCTLSSWQEVFALPTLRSLTLNDVRVKDGGFDQYSVFVCHRMLKLQELTLIDCLLMPYDIVDLFRLTPRVEKLELISMDGFNEDAVPALRELYNLKELFISNCDLSQHNIDEIYSCYQRRLRVLECYY